MSLDHVTQEDLVIEECPQCKVKYQRMSFDDEELRCPRCVNEGMLDGD